MRELLFVYGTLRIPKYQKIAFGTSVKSKPAILDGYARIASARIGKDRFIRICKQQGSSVRGNLLLITAAQLRRSDRYEDLYVRRRVSIRGKITVWVYLPGRSLFRPVRNRSRGG